MSDSKERGLSRAAVGWVLIMAVLVVAGVYVVKRRQPHPTSEKEVGTPGKLTKSRPVGIIDSFGQVPLPAGAEPDKKITTSDIHSYRVPGATYTDLDDWYIAHMPPLEDWKTYTWCDEKVTNGASLTETSRSWRQPGTSNYIIVTVIKETSGKPNAVNIFNDIDDDAPCVNETVRS